MRKKVAFRLKPGSKIIIKETGNILTVVGVAIAHEFQIKNRIVHAIRTPIIMCDDNHAYLHREVLKNETVSLRTVL